MGYILRNIAYKLGNDFAVFFLSKSGHFSGDSVGKFYAGRPQISGEMLCIPRANAW